MNSKKTRRKYVLSQGNDNFNVVTKTYLKNMSRQDALNVCALTWLDLHRLMSKSALAGEDLYMSKNQIRIKVTDGLLNALEVLDITHPMIIKQIKELNLSYNGFKVYKA